MIPEGGRIPNERLKISEFQTFKVARPTKIKLNDTYESANSNNITEIISLLTKLSI